MSQLYFLFFWPHLAVYRVLVPRPRSKPVTPTLGVQPLNHTGTQSLSRFHSLVSGPPGQPLESTIHQRIKRSLGHKFLSHVSNQLLPVFFQSFYYLFYHLPPQGHHIGHFSCPPPLFYLNCDQEFLLTFANKNSVQFNFYLLIT